MRLWQSCDKSLLHGVSPYMAFHIFRREATDYWRRVPRTLANCLKRPHVFLSLRTTSRPVARRVAAQLNAVLDDLAMLAENTDLPLAQSKIETMLRAVVDRHLTKLDLIAHAAKCVSGFDLNQARSDDRRAFWTYALLDTEGVSAVVRAEDRVRMAEDGLSETDIEAVKDHLGMLRMNELVPTKGHILSKMIEEVGAGPTAMNIDLAQGTYFRGMKLALAEIDRRYGARHVEDDGFVDRMLLAQNDPPQRVLSKRADPAARPSDPPKPEIQVTEPLLPMADFTTFAESLIAQNGRDGHWDDKTKRQARSISELFVKFMLQDQHVQDLSSLRQHHVGKFVDFLLQDIYRHHGKSEADKRLTIAQIREVVLRHDKDERGIEGGTLNRYLTFLGQIFQYAGARGADAIAEINLTVLRAKGKSDKRAQNARAKLPPDRAAAIPLVLA